MSIVEENSQRWRVEVVVLTALHGPVERGAGQRGQGEGQGQDDEDDFHGYSAFRVAIARAASDRTVAELTGMMIAAISGVMMPVAARAPARML